MDLSKLEDLKRMLLHDEQLSPIWYFFLDNFGDHSEFHNLGTRINHPQLEDALTQIGQRMLGKPTVISNLIFARIPGRQFIHGGLFMNDCPGGVIYFEDAKIGLASVADLHSEQNAKFARFSPQTTPVQREPSKN